jgi:putative selenate reductase
MAELRPYPLGALIERAFDELARHDAIFDLPARRFVLGSGAQDWSVRFHGRRAATPFGPAAGPHSQMAQNLALSWLAGGRVLELKTVQVKDDLAIPRPCIDVRTVGLNAEWSQELKVDESLAEYVKGSVLIECLAASGALALAPGFSDCVFDLSVGYDLAGIRGEKVDAFLRGMRDASALVDRLRREIPPAHRASRDLPFRARIADTLTLSTFHGCPPDEIERIIEHLQDRHALHCVVKLNPMLLGPGETRRVLHDVLGYRDLRVPDGAFERDTRWEQALGLAERLRARASARGLSFGVKLTNTLIVENPGGYLPASEKEVYLSGPPLHVLAIQLVAAFRREFGDRLPISFSAGVDRRNFADAVALGLAPVTVCTDLLRTGGYARAAGYFEELSRRMDAAGARDVEEWTLKARGHALAALDDCGPAAGRRAACAGALERGEDLRAAAGAELWPRWVSAARVRNAVSYARAVLDDPRYRAERNAQAPRKIGRALVLFDCVTCDKCVPVCPNDAVFTLAITPGTEVPRERLVRSSGRFELVREGSFALTEAHQIASFHDFCNECGNCDVFCPEDGGPHAAKPRFFGSEHAWQRAAPRDGLYVERREYGVRALSRLDRREYEVELNRDSCRYTGDSFDLRFREDDVAGSVTGSASADVDLLPFRLMAALARAALASDAANYVRSLPSSRE